mgnify:FL=1
MEHNAIKLDRFKKIKSNFKTDNIFKIISIARLIDYKGHDLTIEVAQKLKELM